MGFNTDLFRAYICQLKKSSGSDSFMHVLQTIQKGPKSVDNLRCPPVKRSPLAGLNSDIKRP